MMAEDQETDNSYLLHVLFTCMEYNFFEWKILKSRQTESTFVGMSGKIGPQAWGKVAP